MDEGTVGEPGDRMSLDTVLRFSLGAEDDAELPERAVCVAPNGDLLDHATAVSLRPPLPEMLPSICAAAAAADGDDGKPITAEDEADAAMALSIIADETFHPVSRLDEVAFAASFWFPDDLRHQADVVSAAAIVPTVLEDVACRVLAGTDDDGEERGRRSGGAPPPPGQVEG
jgi:hypothetical protein